MSAPCLNRCLIHEHIHTLQIKHQKPSNTTFYRRKKAPKTIENQQIPIQA